LHRPDQPGPHQWGVDLGQRRRHRRGNLVRSVLGDRGAQPLQRRAEQPRQGQLHRHVLSWQPERRIQQRGHLRIGPRSQHQRGRAGLLVQERLGELGL
jgi:hypothetical protein